MQWIIHLFGIFAVISMGAFRHIQGQETQPSDELSFTEAMKKCRLATPDILFRDNKPTLDFGDIGLSLNVGDEAWVGYASEFVMYQYLGCVRKNDVEISGPFETGAKPGYCQVACDKGYFGVMKNNCYCFDSVPTVDSQRSTCYMDCEQPDHGGVCGDWRSISIYTKVDDSKQTDSVEASQSDFDGNCVVFDGNARKFSYTKCTLSFNVGCMTAAEFPYEFDRTFMSWTDMTRHCFKQRLFPLSHNSFRRLQRTTSHTWTGMFRSKTIFTVYSDNSVYHNYGYVRIEESGLPSLRFETASKNTKKRYMCQDWNTSKSLPAPNDESPNTTVTSLLTTGKQVVAITSQEPSLSWSRRNEQITNEITTNNTSRTMKRTSETEITERSTSDTSKTDFTSRSTQLTTETKMSSGVRGTDGLARTTEILDKTTREVTMNRKPSSSTVAFESSVESGTTNTTPSVSEIMNRTVVTDDHLSTYSSTTQSQTVKVGKQTSATEAGQIIFTRKMRSTPKNSYPTTSTTDKITMTNKRNRTGVTKIRTVKFADEGQANLNRENNSTQNLMPVYIVVPILCVVAIIIVAIVLVVKKRKAERRRHYKTEFVMPSWVTLMDMMYGEENNEHI